MGFLETWNEDRQAIETAKCRRLHELCDCLPHPINQKIQIEYWCPCLEKSNYCNFLLGCGETEWGTRPKNTMIEHVTECYPGFRASWDERFLYSCHFQDQFAPHYSVVRLKLLNDDHLFDRVQDRFRELDIGTVEFRKLWSLSRHVGVAGIVYWLRHKHHLEVTKFATSGSRHFPDIEAKDIYGNQGFAEIGSTSVSESFEEGLRKETFPVKVWVIADDSEIIIVPHQRKTIKTVLQYIEDYEGEMTDGTPGRTTSILESRTTNARKPTMPGRLLASCSNSSSGETMQNCLDKSPRRR